MTVGNRDSSIRGQKQNSALTKTQRRGAVTPQETEPKLSANVGQSPVEVWVSRGSRQEQGHLSGKVPLRVNPLRGH